MSPHSSYSKYRTALKSAPRPCLPYLGRWSMEGLKQPHVIDTLNLICSSLIVANIYFLNKRTRTPHLPPPPGVYLTDLTFIGDGNPDRTPDGLINLRKYRMFYKGAWDGGKQLFISIPYGRKQWFISIPYGGKQWFISIPYGGSIWHCSYHIWYTMHFT